MADLSLPASSVLDAPTPPSRWVFLGYLASAGARRRLTDLGGSSWDIRGLPVPTGPDGRCSSPLLVWDREELVPVLRRCGAHRSKQCQACASTYRRRVRRVAATGCLDRAAAGGYLGMATFTAPGDPGHRRWVIGGRAHDLCDCHESASDGMGVWNSLAGRRWDRLRLKLRREYSGAEFFRAVETQQRGSLHLHVVFWSPVPVKPVVLQQLAQESGFGCNTRWDPAGSDPTRFAGYVSKYVTKSTDDRGETPWETLDETTGELVATRPTFRTWSQSRGFGCTMKAHLDAIALQRRRYAERLRLAGEAGVVGQVLDVGQLALLPDDPVP